MHCACSLPAPKYGVGWGGVGVGCIYILCCCSRASDWSHWTAVLRSPCAAAIIAIAVRLYRNSDYSYSSTPVQEQ